MTPSWKNNRDRTYQPLNGRNNSSSSGYRNKLVFLRTPQLIQELSKSTRIQRKRCRTFKARLTVSKHSKIANRHHLSWKTSIFKVNSQRITNSGKLSEIKTSVDNSKVSPASGAMPSIKHSNVKMKQQPPKCATTAASIETTSQYRTHRLSSTT